MKGIIATIVSVAILSGALSAPVVAAHRDTPSPIVPWHHPKGVNAKVGNPIMVGTRWGTCARSEAVGARQHFDVRVEVDGVIYPTVEWSEPKPAPRNKKRSSGPGCLKPPKNGRGWTVYYRVPVTFDSPGEHWLTVTMTARKRITDGTGFVAPRGWSITQGMPIRVSGPVPPESRLPDVPEYETQEYDVPAGSHPHDVAPAPDGSVWYTGQHDGTLGRLDPATGEVRTVPLGAGSRPHGVIVGPDGAPWVTDGGLNAIVRVDPDTQAVTTFPLPPNRPNVNLNTATFDGSGVLWFTGQSGIFGRLDPDAGVVSVFDAPEGRGPYGIASTPEGDVWYASLAGSHIAKIDRARIGNAQPYWPPTQGQGARRLWSDSAGRIWIAEWNAGQLGRYDPASDEWKEWRLPGASPMAYAVYVDGDDVVWLTDFGANAIVRFDPVTEEFAPFPLPEDDAAVRQLLGRPGEVWGAESGLDRLVVIREVPGDG